MAPNSRKKCSSLVAQSLSTSLITSNPSPRIHQLRTKVPHQNEPPNHNLQSLSNGTQPPSTPTSSPSPLDSTPTPDEPPKQPPSLPHAPPFSNFQHPIPFHWTTAHMQTCTRCNLHICIRTHVHTSDSLVSSPTTVVYVSNSVAALKTKRSYRPAAQQPTPTPTFQQPQPTQPSQPRCALCSYAGNVFFFRTVPGAIRPRICLTVPPSTSLEEIVHMHHLRPSPSLLPALPGIHELP